MWVAGQGGFPGIGRLVPEGRVVGMDISDEMVRVARRTSAEHDNVLFITGEVSEIPWEANFFTHGSRWSQRTTGPIQPRA